MSSEPRELSDLELNLPDAPDFFSEPPRYTLAEMIQQCEKMLPYLNAQRYSLGSPYLDPVEMDEFKLLA